MCGIICYIGQQNSIPILLEGLKRLEYRGYDSAGLASINSDSRDVLFVKSVGKVAELEKKVKSTDFNGNYGIAHTRWATHGKPTETNAHPHTDCTGKLFLIHNGIIENYDLLKKELIKKGHKFVSDTDTEVLAHLIEDNLEDNFEDAVRKSLAMVEGTFGIAAIHKDFPRKIVVARRGSPIIIGIGENEYIAASDVNAFIRYTNRVIYLNDDEMALLNDNNLVITDLNLKQIEKKPETIDWQYEADEKEGFKHFMLKEIYEQPRTVENAIRGRLIDGEGISKLGGLEPVLDRILNLKKLTFVSCGTSFYAGLYGKYVFERLTDLDVHVDYASEFRYRNLKLSKDDGVVAISQSGETADTLAALREAKRKGSLVLGLVNVVGSTIAKETHAGVYCHAGPEIGVASTKIFVSQCVILNLIALLIGRRRGLSVFDGMQLVKEIKKLSGNIEKILEKADSIREIAKKYLPYQNFLYIGRHLNFPIAMEGALKLKEISYVHAEGYPAGEMKHGPISLIDENFPTVAIATNGFTYEKMISNIQEIKARNGKVIAVATEGNDEIKNVVDDVIYVPEAVDILQPILNVIPLQLFAYYFADFKGCDIDKPRNLAKSVTVE